MEHLLCQALFWAVKQELSKSDKAFLSWRVIGKPDRQ